MVGGCVRIESDGREISGTAAEILDQLKLRSPFTRDLTGEEYRESVRRNLRRWFGLHVGSTPEEVLRGLVRVGAVRMLEEGEEEP